MVRAKAHARSAQKAAAGTILLLAAGLLYEPWTGTRWVDAALQVGIIALAGGEAYRCLGHLRRAMS